MAFGDGLEIMKTRKEIKERKETKVERQLKGDKILKSKKCEYCGKEFSKRKGQGYEQWNIQKFCSRECANKGTKKTPPNLKGHKFSKKHNEKISKARIGIKLSEETKKKIGEASKGRKHTLEWKENMRKRMLGDKNPSWKGGVTKISILIRNSGCYSQWRSDVLQRDNWTCQTCGKRGCKLDVHHIKPFSRIVKDNKIKTMEDAIAVEELWDINNGVTLCKDCHKLTDNYLKYTIN